jgi:hypothetical protein
MIAPPTKATANRQFCYGWTRHHNARNDENHEWASHRQLLYIMRDVDASMEVPSLRLTDGAGVSLAARCWSVVLE